MRISVLVSSVLAAAFLAVSADAATDPKGAAASAPKQTSAKTREQPWIAQCTSASRKGKLTCVVNKRIVLANTGQLLAAITIRVPPEASKSVMMLQVPLGLNLPRGVTLAVGKAKPVTVPLETCESTGCFAGQAISDDLLKKLRGGEKLLLAFNIGQQDIKITVSLDGFAAAYDSVK